jgi:hypothetical protein
VESWVKIMFSRLPIQIYIEPSFCPLLTPREESIISLSVTSAFVNDHAKSEWNLFSHSSP